jgi:hypothetical protein
MKGIPVLPNGDPVTRTFVIARDFRMFHIWCQYSRVNPNSLNVVYVSSYDRLRGQFRGDFAWVGCWWERKDSSEISRLADYMMKRDGYSGKSLSFPEPADIEPNIC